jgi:hypothetical protein
VQLLGAAGAVLVVLQLGERDLRAPLEPGEHERLRVGLLEVVDALVDEVLAELVLGRLPLHVRREGGSGHRLGDVEEPRGDVPPGLQRVLHPLLGGEAQLCEQPVLERAAHADEPGVPLPLVVDAVEAPVVELVEHPQGELHVLVGEQVDVVGQGLHRSHEHLLVEQVAPVEGPDQGRAQRSAFTGEVHRTPRVYRLAAEEYPLHPPVTAAHARARGEMRLVRWLRRPLRRFPQERSG